MQEMGVWSLSQEDPLEKQVATHSSISVWEIPWTMEPGRLQSMMSQRAEHDLATKQQKGTRNQFLSFIERSLETKKLGRQAEGRLLGEIIAVV